MSNAALRAKSDNHQPLDLVIKHLSFFVFNDFTLLILRASLIMKQISLEGSACEKEINMLSAMICILKQMALSCWYLKNPILISEEVSKLYSDLSNRGGIIVLIINQIRQTKGQTHIFWSINKELWGPTTALFTLAHDKNVTRTTMSWKSFMKGYGPHTSLWILILGWTHISSSTCNCGDY